MGEKRTLSHRWKVTPKKTYEGPKWHDHEDKAWLRPAKRSMANCFKAFGWITKEAPLINPEGKVFPQLLFTALTVPGWMERLSLSDWLITFLIKTAKALGLWSMLGNTQPENHAWYAISVKAVFLEASQIQEMFWKNLSAYDHCSLEIFA